MESISEIVKSGDLPPESSEILPLITNEDGTFLDQEGTVWDFKRSWPFSYSDDYFFGICRLICAFSNTEGGIIIFGVHDESRTGGHNKTRPNLDRLEQAFEQLTGFTPNLKVRSYKDTKSGDVDILLVCQTRGADFRPMRFKEDAGHYPANVIYIRHGSQVREATSNDIGTLYLTNDPSLNNSPPKGQLPPSPATVREFVGRMEAIDRIFAWLKVDDEPRAFLYGKGGSGKSTIAYQVYKSIKVSGSDFYISGSKLDRLIFISAKKQYLNVENQSSESFVGNDFSNEVELYQAILTLGDHSFSTERMNEIGYLKSEIKEFFNNNSCFVVIDDIDTLSTAEEETGMDFLLGVLWRSKKSSKLLYTLRNRPSQSLKSSLEIPGLVGEEFIKFVDVCSKQFHVTPPSTSARDNLIYPTSEGRPLVIESIVALRRTAGSYPEAVRLFESEAGNDVRDYVFRREWDALDKTDRGREILTILALYNGPISVQDIIIISRMDGSKVRDALASVQEIFLNVEITEDDTIYSIGSLTRGFVLELAPRLNFYDTIKARVDNFKNTFYANSPTLNTLINRFHRSAAAAENGETVYLEKLLADLDDEKDPKLSEDPRFLCLRAAVRLTNDLSDVSKARTDFETAMDFRHSPDADDIMLWLRAEKAGDAGDQMTKEILDRVNRAKGYNTDFKTRIRFDRACYLYGRGKSLSYTDEHKSVEFLEESLGLHLQAFRSMIESDSPLASRSNEYTKNTCFSLFHILKNSTDSDRFIKIIDNITVERRVFIDPIIEPMMTFMRYPLIYGIKRKDVLQRKFGRFQTLISKLSKRDIWMSKYRSVELENFSKEIRKQYESAV